MAQTKPRISIVNVVSSVTTDHKLDLVEITKKFPDVEYDPDQFSGAVFRLSNPRTATLIFQTGNMACAGARHEREIHRSVNQIHSLKRKI